jgi:acetylornithine deacetylase
MTDLAERQLTALERAAMDRVDEAWITERLRAIVATPSITGTEDAVQDQMAGIMEEIGLDVRRVETDPAELARDPDFPGMEVERTTLPVVAGHLDTGRPGPRVLLVGHVDVVPPGDPELWSSPPFEAVLRDGRVHGRGANDMKGGVISATAAMRAVASVLREDPGLAGEAILVTVPGEEDGGAGMLAAIRAGYTGDVAVITEPTSLRVVTVQAGAITFRLTIHGRAAHASMRREGVSALEKLIVIHEALRADETARNEAEHRPEMRALELPYPTIIGRVEAGDWSSTVPDRLVAEGRYGVVAGQTAAEAEVDLRACIDRACEGDAWLRDHRPELVVYGGRFSSAETPASHPLPQAVAAAARDALGLSSPFAGVPYGADMRLLVNEGRTPTVIFGPGHPRQAHTTDEWVPVDEVVDCARALSVWLLRALRAEGDPER